MLSETTTMVRLETFLVVLTMACVIAANDSAIKNLYDPATTITQVGATETDNTGPAKVFDEELDRKFHAEYRSLQSSERLQHQHDDDRGFLQGYVKCRNGSVSITRHSADSIRSLSLENESPKETFDAFVMDETNEKGDHHMPNVSFAKRMGGVDNVMLPAKQIKSKPLHFSQQDRDIGDVVLYRPKNRSHDGYQRSRILVQKNLEEDRHSGKKLNSDVPGSAGISGRLRDVHQGQSLFYDSSAELVGVASEDIPVKIVPIETKVLPDDCEGQNDHNCSTLAPPEKRNGTTTLLNSTMLPFETRVTGEHPEWSTVLSALNATESGIRLAKTVLHHDSEEHPEHKNGPKQNSREVIESRSSNSKPARGRNRASSGRSLFKFLAGQQYSDIFNGSNNKNTTTDATIDKENKMNPFRFGLQQLFTPRLPMARLPGYPQMITYAPQYHPVGSLLYPTRTPLLPLYTTTALLPITAHMASSTTAISTARTPLQDPVTLNAASNNNNKPITTDPAKCSGECVDVFAALMCKRVDEEAKCALSNQRCCVGGAEQVRSSFDSHTCFCITRSHNSSSYVFVRLLALK